MENYVQQHYMLTGKKPVPAGVKIIAVLFFIGAFILVVLGKRLFSAPGESMYGRFFSLLSLSGLSFLKPNIIIIISLVSIAIGVLFYFIGIGLWRGKKWARIVAIILALLVSVLSIYFYTENKNIFKLMSDLFIYLIMIIYLLFSRAVKESFS